MFVDIVSANMVVQIQVEGCASKSFQRVELDGIIGECVVM